MVSSSLSNKKYVQLKGKVKITLLTTFHCLVVNFTSDHFFFSKNSNIKSKIHHCVLLLPVLLCFPRSPDIFRNLQFKFCAKDDNCPIKNSSFSIIQIAMRKRRDAAFLKANKTSLIYANSGPPFY